MTLKECDSVDLTRISSPNDYIAAASSSETLEQIEEIVTAWIKQIEQVTHAQTFNKEKKEWIVTVYARRKGFLVVGPGDFSSSRPGVSPDHVSVFCSLLRNFALKVSLFAQF